ncbi:MAG TPA: hypothetical protein VFG53_05370 [Anaeromyxobacter sp.]|nr:hypothetical protein [Anaeromyxobacter sp.]
MTTAVSPPREDDPAEAIAALLAPHLGPHTARNAVRTFCERTLAIPPASLAWASVPRLVAALEPALRTLLGTDAASSLAREILTGVERR